MTDGLQFGFANRDAATASEAGRAVVPGHDVQLYDSDEFLISTVGEYLADGVRLGQPIVVIATTAHMRALMVRLHHLGVDPDDLVDGRDAVWLDAGEVLAAFVEGGRPNREMFAATVGSVLERLTGNRPYAVVRAYGEMVDLLWRAGKAESAIVLEELWNELAIQHRFALLCGYAKESLQADPDPERLERMHAQHARVHPFDASRTS